MSAADPSFARAHRAITRRAIAAACVLLLNGPAVTWAAEDGALVSTPPGGGRAFNLMGVQLTVKIGAAESGGQLTVVECVVPPREGIPYHAHLHEDMTYVVLDGELVLQDSTSTRRYPAGSYIHAPRGTFHALRNFGDKPARMVVVYTPAYDESFYAEMHDTPALSQGEAAGAAVAKRAGARSGVVLKPAPGPIQQPPVAPARP